MLCSDQADELCRLRALRGGVFFVFASTSRGREVEADN